MVFLEITGVFRQNFAKNPFLLFCKASIRGTPKCIIKRLFISAFAASPQKPSNPCAKKRLLYNNVKNSEIAPSLGSGFGAQAGRGGEGGGVVRTLPPQPAAFLGHQRQDSLGDVKQGPGGGFCSCAFKLFQQMRCPGPSREIFLNGRLGI